MKDGILTPSPTGSQRIINGSRGLLSRFRRLGSCLSSRRWVLSDLDVDNQQINIKSAQDIYISLAATQHNTTKHLLQSKLPTSSPSPLSTFNPRYHNPSHNHITSPFRSKALASRYTETSGYPLHFYHSSIYHNININIKLNVPGNLTPNTSFPSLLNRSISR